MKTAFVLFNHLSHQKTWGDAFALGLARHGWTVDGGRDWKASDMLVTWGVRKVMDMHDQRTHGGQICILERGYIGDRQHWTSVSFGGELNNRAEFSGPFEDATRFQRYHAHLLQPWRPWRYESPEGLALLIGQVEGDESIKRFDMPKWYRETTAHLRAFGYEVKFRPHPQGGPPQRNARSLAADLAEADICVTMNSNAGVEAVLAGVPTFALDQGSMAWPVTTHDLAELPYCPPREAWAHALAWKQYSIEEMASGLAWDAIGRERVAA